MKKESIQPWKELESKIHVYSPFRKIEDVLFELPDGRREIYSLNHVGKVVCVLAFTEKNQVILARQFRPGPKLVLDELPGGGVETDETTEEAVRRELLEETGYSPGTLIPLGRFYECAYSTIERHAVLALQCKKVREQALDPTEFIQVILKPLPDFLDQLKSGMSTDLEVAFAGLLKAGYLHVNSNLA